MKKSVKKQLVSFIADCQARPLYPHNEWLVDRVMKVYVRHSHRGFNDGLVKCLDIANAEVSRKYRGMGHFKDFVAYAETINPWDGIWLENLWSASEETLAHYAANGYTILRYPNWAPSLIKIKHASH